MAKTIVINAGHYTGYNKSPNYPEYIEGNAMWELSQYLRAELITYGFNVKCTRNSRDKDVPVYTRGQMASGGDLYLSLHSNAVTNKSVRRVVVIPPYERKDVYDLANKLAQDVSACMGVTEAHQLYTRTYIDNETKKKVNYYGEIRGAVSVGCYMAVILEHSFHTNPDTARWLCDKENLKELARVEAKTIADYFGMKKKNTTESGEDVKALEKRIKTLETKVKALEAKAKVNAPETVYAELKDIPEYGRATVQKLIKKDIIEGDGKGLNITEDMLRILVMNDRAGCYDE